MLWIPPLVLHREVYARPRYLVCGRHSLDLQIPLRMGVGDSFNTGQSGTAAYLSNFCAPSTLAPTRLGGYGRRYPEPEGGRSIPWDS